MDHAHRGPEISGREPGATATIAEYVAALSLQGVPVVPGSQGTWWMGDEGRSLFREPVFCLNPPLPGEVSRALWKARAPVAAYTLEGSPSNRQNAWLYVCRDNDYSMEKLAAPVRRNIRRALQSFRFEFLDAEVFLDKGITAYCDTRQRLGLSDGTPAAFMDRFKQGVKNPGHTVLGAWKDDVLAAFMSLDVVDDWAGMVVFAATQYLPLRPNNGLVHAAFDYFLVRRKFRIVSNGLSSIQEGGRVDSLHRFKTGVGFEAVPVHRAFMLHPLLAPFANRISLWGLRACSRIRPRNRALRKAAGMLAAYLGRHQADSKSMKGPADRECAQ